MTMILIIAGSQLEASEWIKEELRKDPFRAALRRANKVSLWHGYKYIGREQDLMGRDRRTPIRYVGQYWNNPVYHSVLLREFSTPVPTPQKLFGVDIATWANSLTQIGIYSGKSTVTADSIAQTLQAFKDYTEKDIQFTGQIHDSLMFEVKEK